MGSESGNPRPLPSPPPPQHTLTNEPMKKIYESQREKKMKKMKNQWGDFSYFLKEGKKEKRRIEFIDLHATEVQ